MARARMIKPGFFTNDELAEVAPLGRLLWAGLWTIADRAGRLRDRPRKIQAEILPYDACDVDALLDDLARHGFVLRYRINGEAVLQVVNWDRHQQPHINEKPSELPPPPDGLHASASILVPEPNGAALDLAPEQYGTSTVQVPECSDTNPPRPLSRPDTSNPVLDLDPEDIPRARARGAAAAAAVYAPELAPPTAEDEPDQAPYLQLVRPVSAPEPETEPVPDPVDWVWDYYREWIQPAARECPRSLISARLRKFSVDELTVGIEHFARDAWCMDTNAHRGGKWFFASDARSEQFLLMEPRAAAGGRRG